MTDRDGSSTDSLDVATEVFAEHRNLLFTIAYEMLGSAVDAEDAVQETWLRWTAVDLETVRDRRAYLARIVSRQALTQLRTLGRRKEAYVGPWLPEPLVITPDVADDVVLADSVSTAMLLVLETLKPTERAVFVLREVFAFDYDEISEVVDKSQAAVRQIAHRARGHVADRRPREAVTDAEADEVVDAFQRALQTGDLQSLLDKLAPDVVLISDGGGVKQAVLKPLKGARRVGKLLGAGFGELGSRVSGRRARVNGRPAFLLHLDGRLDTVITMRIEGGQITGLYAVRNPEKLDWMDREQVVAR